jgi:hypothetical protein
MNIFFMVTEGQVHNPHSKWWIIKILTTEAETLFITAEARYRYLLTDCDRIKLENDKWMNMVLLIITEKATTVLNYIWQYNYNQYVASKNHKELQKVCWKNTRSYKTSASPNARNYKTFGDGTAQVHNIQNYAIYCDKNTKNPN